MNTTEEMKVKKKRFLRNGGQFKAYFEETDDNIDRVTFNDFTKLSDEFTKEIESVLQNIDYERTFFVSFNRSGGVKTRSGVDLRNLLWWNIKIDDSFLKDKYRGYTNILLCAYRIAVDDVAKINIGNDKPFPNMDIRTGNIHVTFNLFKWVKKNKNCSEKLLPQAVLVGSGTKTGGNPGPKLGVCNKKGDFRKEELHTREINEIKSIKFPKACYFPRIETVDEGISCKYPIRKLLRGLLEDKLNDDGRSKLNFYRKSQIHKKDRKRITKKEEK